VPLTSASEVALPLREPSKDALGLGWEVEKRDHYCLHSFAPQVSHQVMTVPSDVPKLAAARLVVVPDKMR
jgi:hypothetical protein